MSCEWVRIWKEVSVFYLKVQSRNSGKSTDEINNNNAVGISDTSSASAWSQWPRGLRHVQSSTARTMESWVWIPLEACMCVHVFLCCAVLRRWWPCDGLIPRPRSPTKCPKIKVKVKLSLCSEHHAMKAYWGSVYSSTHSLTLALHGDEWSASRHGRFTSRERAPSASIG
jgi:hypothetical protein